MARRKRKKQSLSKSLKYEIYGILLITSSVIALSGGAAFGRALSKLFGLLLGKFYFVIPLVLIYVGLAVMIKRQWPNGWSARKSGLLIILIGFTMMSTMSAVEMRLLPVADDISAGSIFQAIHNTMKEELITAAETGTASDMWNKDISGGYIGAALYCLVFALFGALGTKLLIIVLFIIGFMLATQLSYVELAQLMRTQIKKLMKAIHKQRKARINERKVREAEQKKREVSKNDNIPDFSDDEDSEEYGPPRKASKTPVFFQLFGDRRNVSNEDELVDADDEWLDRSLKRKGKRTKAESAVEAEWTDVPSSDADARTGRDAQHTRGYHSTSNVDNDPYENEAEDRNGPLFRDFMSPEYDGWNPAADGQIGTQDDVDEDWNIELDNVSDGKQSTTGMVDASLPSLPQLPAAGEEVSSTLDVTNGIQQDSVSNEEEIVVPVKPPVKPYKLPNFSLLAKPQGSGKGGEQADFMQTARKLEATLESFSVRAKVLEVVRGPAVTRYEIQPDIGVKVSRIVSLSDDIALALAAKDIRMEAPIPGKSAIGIEVPNNEVSIVTMREVMETPTFVDANSNITIALGRDISGAPIIGNLARMPHLLVAGATGSGKSVCINGIITSILYKAKPDEVKFLMIDPKMVELNVYNGIPHLLAPVVTDPRRASLALKKIVVEMEKRYELFSKSATRNIEGYNKLVGDDKEKLLPYIVVIVDELADLMMVAANDVEDAICRLAQMARAAGIHLIIATQRPSVDVITGVIKANIPSRIAFGVSSQVDSRTILDMAGAEKLLGRGDMLYLPMGSSKPQRVQGAFLSDPEVEAVVSFCRDQGTAEYNEDLVPEIDDLASFDGEPVDELFEQAVTIVLEGQQASASLLQRRLRVGYNRASRLIESMQMQGIIGPPDGSRPREVLMTLEQYQQTKLSS
ncbi:FtsK/SpoIIIE family DNA translocase [Paenibacillus agilis]|uniref:DNA translocase FtsK n=1 Tax=Paenibacillus agilis TaxID=3020863 RepID=A0A559J216_9BACL|nr:DNA translocase FtsK [Paenibacillus agilis]TVX93924.1 DNA translocase FtsK [Paenibacillus agilis]